MLNPPQQTNTAQVIRSLPCGDESERKSFFRNIQPPSPCEAIWLNDASAGYVFANKLWIREKMIQQGKAGMISFPMLNRDPTMAIEMKTEWQLDKVDSTRYVIGQGHDRSLRGLVAFHMMMRAQENWIWATFIHEDFLGQVVAAGENPADSFGDDNGHLSDQLSQLLRCKEGNVLCHYKLIGTQTDFTTPDGKPTLLGNPLIETAEAIKAGKISCISCHAQVLVDNLGRLKPFDIKPGKPPAAAPVFYSVNFNFTLEKHARCIGRPTCNNDAH